MFVGWKDRYRNRKCDILKLTADLYLPQMQRKEKPTCNVYYCKYVKGVDYSDQMMSYAPFHRKTI